MMGVRAARCAAPTITILQRHKIATSTACRPHAKDSRRRDSAPDGQAEGRSWDEGFHSGRCQRLGVPAHSDTGTYRFPQDS
jgi:hypothetical protein